jgi:hypothetical protein
MNCIISVGVENAECPAGETQSTPIGTPRDLAADLRGRQHAAVAGLGTLAELELHHLDLLERGSRGEFVLAEGRVRVAATEVP